jgi:hypothetical protein
VRRGSLLPLQQFRQPRNVDGDAPHSQLRWSARGRGRRASWFALPRRASPPKSTEAAVWEGRSRDAPPIPTSRVTQQMSADVDDARLGLCLSWRLRLRRKLKHRCLLTLMQVRQENKRAIRKFECIMMSLRYVLVDLSKDRRSGAYCSPAKETGGTSPISRLRCAADTAMSISAPSIPIHHSTANEPARILNADPRRDHSF